MPFLNDDFEIAVVRNDRNEELRIRVSVNMPGKNFTEILLFRNRPTPVAA